MTFLSLSVSGAADDALGQAFRDRGLADPRLADEDGVVLRAAAQDLDDAADLLVAPDDRVQLAGPSLGREVAAVLLQGLIRGFRIRAGHALAAANPDQGLEDCLFVCPAAFEQLLSLAASLGDGQEKVLGGDVLVLEPPGFVTCMLDGVAEPRIGGERTALDPGPFAENGRQLAAEGGHVDADPAQGLRRDAVVGLDERGEEVLGIEHGALEFLGEALGRDDGLLSFLGETIEIHRLLTYVAAGGARS